jgi:hypothetical protein
LTEITDDPRYAEARAYACRLRGFYIHATVFILVNAGFFALNLETHPGRPWFGWATLWWGVGLVAHGVSVFALGNAFGRQWEERTIRRYLERRP